MIDRKLIDNCYLNYSALVDDSENTYSIMVLSKELRETLTPQQNKMLNQIISKCFDVMVLENELYYKQGFKTAMKLNQIDSKVDLHKLMQNFMLAD